MKITVTRKRFCTLFVAILLVLGCKSQTVSTVTGSGYEEEKDQTEYSVSPYGSVLIPGKWEKKDYFSSSKQQFFINADLVACAVALTPTNQFEFNTDGSKSGFEFIRSYYEWERNYFAGLGLKNELVEENESEGYLIWRCYGTLNNSEINYYFLYREKGNVSFSLFVTLGKWTSDDRIRFLKSIQIK